MPVIVGAPTTPAPSGTHMVPDRCVPVPHVVGVPEPSGTQVSPCRVVPAPHVTVGAGFVVLEPQAARIEMLAKESQFRIWAASLARILVGTQRDSIVGLG